MKIFLVVAQVFKKPHIAKNEDCAKEIADLKPGGTSTGMLNPALTLTMNHAAINSSTFIICFPCNFQVWQENLTSLFLCGKGLYLSYYESNEQIHRVLVMVQKCNLIIILYLKFSAVVVL